jgi:hypothetical protein
MKTATQLVGSFPDLPDCQDPFTKRAKTIMRAERERRIRRGAARWLPISSCYQCRNRDTTECLCLLTNRKRNRHPIDGIPEWCPLPKTAPTSGCTGPSDCYLVVVSFDDRHRYWNRVVEVATLEEAAARVKAYENMDDCAGATIYRASHVPDNAPDQARVLPSPECSCSQEDRI